ncbi:hypothetical protein NMY22_g8281 [Coprinellus aureogranulatus]|nr:hypothetical protein NMY22_g8281 [Coprinellus aureogranulatus]
MHGSQVVQLALQLVAGMSCAPSTDGGPNTTRCQGAGAPHDQCKGHKQPPYPSPSCLSSLPHCFAAGIHPPPTIDSDAQPSAVGIFSGSDRINVENLDVVIPARDANLNRTTETHHHYHNNNITLSLLHIALADVTVGNRLEDIQRLITSTIAIIHSPHTKFIAGFALGIILARLGRAWRGR